jgi:hypothetical protein
MLLVGAGSGLQALVSADSSQWVLLPGLAVVGIGVGLAIPTLTAAAMSAAPPQLGGMVAGTLNTARQLGFALGVAVLGLVFQHSAGDVEALAAGHGAAADAVADGLRNGYLVAGAAGLVGGLLVLALVRPVVRAHQAPVPARV